MTQDFLAHSILESIISVVGQPSADKVISLHEPSFKGTKAWDYLKDCLDSGWVSSAGQWVDRFENSLASYTGAARVVAVTNGTVALRLALHLVGVKPGDEVLLPPLSFVATANAVSHLGAVPHFVDIEPSTLALSPRALHDRLVLIAERRGAELFNRQTGRRLAAVVPVHVFGNPANVAELRQVADEWGLLVVEDAAEALGSWRGGVHCGLVGEVGVLSFNGNKLITTGGGGALITNNVELAERAKHLSTTAKKPHPWEFDHDAVGWNDRLPNLNAALGVAQLEDLDSRLSAKRNLALRYERALSQVPSIRLLSESSACISNNWLISLCFTSHDAQVQRHDLLQRAHAIGLMLRPVWKLLHHLPMYRAVPSGDLSIAEDMGQRLVNLPSSPQLLV